MSIFHEAFFMEDHSQPPITNNTEESPGQAPSTPSVTHCDHCGELEEKLKGYEAGWKRALADYQNLRKEIDEGRQHMALMLKGYLLEQLFPIIDHFDEALGTMAEGAASDEWNKGLVHVRRELDEFLKRQGVESFGAVGEVFDPVAHDAVETVADGEGTPHSIVKICSRGYRAMGRVIRPARVVVHA